MLAFLLKTEYIKILKPKFKPTMDFEYFLPDQVVVDNIHNCRYEIGATLLLVKTLLTVCGLVVFCCIKDSSSRVERLERKNRTLKKIIMSTMEAGILKMMMKNGNDDDDDDDE